MAGSISRTEQNLLTLNTMLMQRLAQAEAALVVARSTREVEEQLAVKAETAHDVATQELRDAMAPRRDLICEDTIMPSVEADLPRVGSSHFSKSSMLPCGVDVADGCDANKVENVYGLEGEDSGVVSEIGDVVVMNTPDEDEGSCNMSFSFKKIESPEVDIEQDDASSFLNRWWSGWGNVADAVIDCWNWTIGAFMSHVKTIFVCLGNGSDYG